MAGQVCQVLSRHKHEQALELCTERVKQEHNCCPNMYALNQDRIEVLAKTNQLFLRWVRRGVSAEKPVSTRTCPAASDLVFP